MRLHHTGVSVADLDRSLAWYCEVFGFTPGHRFEIAAAQLRGAFAVGPGGVAVELLEQAGSRPGEERRDPPSANAIRGFNHICVAVDDLDTAYAWVLENGARPVWDPRDAPEAGVRMAYIADLDGNLVELIQLAEEITDTEASAA
jgi:lactoylglutathione lyase